MSFKGIYSGWNERIYYTDQSYTALRNLPKGKPLSAVVHHLIALNQPIATIEKFAGGKLTQEDPKNHLTPLALTLILGKNDVACALIKQGAKLEYRNSQGLTALHYVVLAGREEGLDPAFKELLDTVTDIYNGTPNDFKTYWKPLEEGDIGISYREQDETLTPLFQETFRLRAGASYTSTPRATPEDFLLYRRNRNDQSNRTTNPKILGDFESKPPVLHLTDESPCGLGVVAGSAISRDAIICSFAGKLLPEDHYPSYKSHMYGYGYIDSLEVCNLAPLINAGTPNAQLTKLSGYKGLPSYACVKALRDIDAGEVIHLTYGTQHPLERGKYYLSAQATSKLLDYYNKYDLVNIYKGPNCTLYGDMMFIHFFNARVFMTLHLQKIVSLTHTAQALKRLPMLFKDDPNAPVFFHCAQAMLASMSNLLAEEKKHPGTVQTFLCFLDEFTLNTTVQLLLNIMSDEDGTPENLKSLKSLGGLLDGLYEFTHGTLLGSLWDHPEEYLAKAPQLSCESILTKYNLMSKPHQEYFFSLLSRYIESVNQKDSALKQMGYMSTYLGQRGILLDQIKQTLVA